MHWLTRVVMDKGPFNRLFFVHSKPMHPHRTYQNFISPLTLSDPVDIPSEIHVPPLLYSF